MHPFKLLSSLFLYNVSAFFTNSERLYIYSNPLWYVMRHCLDSLWKTFNLLNLLFALILKNHKELDLDCSKDVALIRLFLSLSNFCFIRWCIVMTYKIHLEHTLLRSSWLCNMYSVLSNTLLYHSYSYRKLSFIGFSTFAMFLQATVSRECREQGVIFNVLISVFRQCIGSFNNSQLLVKIFL